MTATMYGTRALPPAEALPGEVSDAVEAWRGVGAHRQGEGCARESSSRRHRPSARQGRRGTRRGDRSRGEAAEGPARGARHAKGPRA
jgi:hypothetical protein